MADNKDVFRKVSLERLSSPEQLDQRLRVVSPIGWFALLSLAALICAALLWGVLGNISNKVAGNGILLYGDGIVNLVADTTGQITDVNIQEGDVVEKGQVIARVSQDELILQIEQAKENLAAIDAISVETLDLDIDALNLSVYPDFADIAGQIRMARAQYHAQMNEYNKNTQDVQNAQELKSLRISTLQEQMTMLDAQIDEYTELMEYQREVDEELAWEQDRINERQTSSSVPDGIVYMDTAGNYYRRRMRAPRQFTVYDQTGSAYIILGDSSSEDTPVIYLLSSGEEIYNPDGDYYLPNYRESVDESIDYDDARGARTARVYIETVTGVLYIDATDDEFRRVSNDDDYESSVNYYDQAVGRPDYDAQLESLKGQRLTVLQQLEQATLESQQAGVSFTAYLQSGYTQTGVQIENLTQRFADIKILRTRELEKEITDLQSRLALTGQITADTSGTVLNFHYTAGDFVQSGMNIGTVVRETVATENTSVVMYVPVADGKKIAEGMEVNVSPSTVNREEYGYIIGRVRHVSAYAASEENILATLRNQQLAYDLTQGNAVIEVEVELLRSNNTVSRYQWSTPKGPPVLIDAGTMCSGEVRVSSQRPIDMVMPFIRKFFSGAVSGGE